MNLLYREKSIYKSVIPATLFYLLKKGYYTIENSAESDLVFVRVDSNEPTSPHLKYFVNWLSSYEENNSFSLKTIAKNLSTSSGARDFQTHFLNWQVSIKEDAEELGFYFFIENKKVLSNEYYNKQIKWKAYIEI